MKTYLEFLLEKKKNHFIFPIEDGKLNIMGQTFDVLDFIKDYEDSINYVFGTVVDDQYMYIPSKKEMRVKLDGEKDWKKCDVDYKKINLRTIKVKKQLITYLDAESVTRSRIGATHYEIKYPFYVEVFAGDKLLKSYQIDKETGELI